MINNRDWKSETSLKVSIISNSVLRRVKKKILTFRNVCCDLFLEKNDSYRMNQVTAVKKIISSANDSFSASWYLGDNFMWRKTKHNLQNTLIQIHEKVKCIYFHDYKQFRLLDIETHQYCSWWQFLDLRNILRNQKWIISVKFHHQWEKIHSLAYLPGILSNLFLGEYLIRVVNKCDTERARSFQDAPSVTFERDTILWPFLVSYFNLIFIL